MPAIVTPRSPASVKSERPCRPGGCSCAKKTLRSWPCVARHCRRRRWSVRSVPGPYSPGWRRWSSSNSVTALRCGLDCSSGSNSASQTSARGSRRVRHRRGGRCEGSDSCDSIRRALRSLTPALAAAATWVCARRLVLYVSTWWSVILLPGIPPASTSRRRSRPRSWTFRPRPSTGQDSCRQPAKIVVAGQSIAVQVHMSPTPSVPFSSRFRFRSLA